MLQLAAPRRALRPCATRARPCDAARCAAAATPPPAASRRAVLTAAPLLALLPPCITQAAARAAAEGGALAPFVAKCGAVLQLPASWIAASDRENTGRGALTLNLVGNFDTVDTVSLRRELLPADGAGWLDGSVSAAEVAARLTAPERAAVAAGDAGGAVVGVANGSSGTLSFELLSSAQRAGDGAGGAPYYSVETRSEQCRGTVQEGKGGALLCFGPRGDELPTITRHALSVYVAKPPFLYVLRASCVEDRWASLAPLLRDVTASFDARGITNPAA